MFNLRVTLKKKKYVSWTVEKFQEGRFPVPFASTTND